MGTPEVIPPTPIRLQWDIRFECQSAINTALKVANSLIADIDLRIYVHDNYGKGFVKQCSLSPDAYLQMALQLAYYRDAGKFSLTYEASMTRLFREGRTETVRPCTVESVAWVKAMENPESNTNERVRLLRVACQRHQVITTKRIFFLLKQTQCFHWRAPAFWFLHVKCFHCIISYLVNYADLFITNFLACFFTAI